MLEVSPKLEPFKALIQNYKINLLEVSKIDNLDAYSDDMKKSSEAIGEKRGEARGKAIGQKQGETRLSTLMNRLFEDERINDVKKAINDSKFREIMYQEYGIK